MEELLLSARNAQERLTMFRKTEMHTAESLVPEPVCSEDEIAIDKLKRPSTGTIPPKLIQAGNPQTC
jgi:hypothetical protein